MAREGTEAGVNYPWSEEQLTPLLAGVPRSRWGGPVSVGGGRDTISSC